MPDYRRIIDAETWAFIEKTDAQYPPDTAQRSIAEQRLIYDEMCRTFFAGYPNGVETEDLVIQAAGPKVPARRYSTGSESGARILYFHGGGFMLGGLHSHDDICAELCARSGLELVSVDYRLAPEHRHPAAFEDAMAAFGWVAEDERPAILCGDSAGGNLAAAVAHHSRQCRRPPLGQVLIYPGLGGDSSSGSYIEHADAPMLTTRDVLYYDRLRATPSLERDSSFSPLLDTDFSALPPTVIVTAQCDPLSSDGEIYARHIRMTGGRAVWIEEPGLVHGFLRARHSVSRARESFNRIVLALVALGKGEWPYEP